VQAGWQIPGSTLGGAGSRTTTAPGSGKLQLPAMH
jgi:hypothetical protein